MTIIPFLKDLAENNNRSWFAENRERYDIAHKEFTELTATLIQQIGQFDPEIKYLEPKECIFRIYRDIRFSPDKSPYKRHFGTYIAKNGGHKSIYSGYYLHLQPSNCSLSGGIWCPDSKATKQFREYIDCEYQELRQIMSAPEFKKYYGEKLDAFETLKRPPMGYKADHPAIEILKLKQWLVSYPFEDKLVDSPNFIEEIVKAAEAMKPFSYWCNRGLEY